MQLKTGSLLGSWFVFRKKKNKNGVEKNIASTGSSVRYRLRDLNNIWPAWNWNSKKWNKWTLIRKYHWEGKRRINKRQRSQARPLPIIRTKKGINEPNQILIEFPVCFVKYYMLGFCCGFFSFDHDYKFKTNTSHRVLKILKSWIMNFHEKSNLMKFPYWIGFVNFSSGFIDIEKKIIDKIDQEVINGDGVFVCVCLWQIRTSNIENETEKKSSIYIKWGFNRKISQVIALIFQILYHFRFDSILFRCACVCVFNCDSFSWTNTETKRPKK